MRFLTLVLLLAVVAVAQSASAALIVSLGSTTVQRNATNQPLQVFLRSDSGPVENVIAMDIFAFIGDGSAIQTTPRFDGTPGTREAVQFADGAGGQPFVWENLPSGFSESGDAPEPDNVYRSSVGVDANDLTESVTIGTSETLVGQFFIDTTGFSGGTFDFTIANSAGGTSVLYTFDGSDLAEIPFEGSFQVTAVPEPSSLALLGAFAATGAGMRRVRRRKRVAAAK